MFIPPPPPGHFPPSANVLKASCFLVCHLVCRPAVFVVRMHASIVPPDFCLNLRPTFFYNVCSSSSHDHSTSPVIYCLMYHGTIGSKFVIRLIQCRTPTCTCAFRPASATVSSRASSSSIVSFFVLSLLLLYPRRASLLSDHS